MSLFFETIRILDGEAMHLKYHNRRFRRTRSELFGIDEATDLGTLLDPPSRGLIRCKVIYDRQIRRIEYHPYTPRRIRSVRLLCSEITYDHKALDRRVLDELFSRRGSCDEILIVDPKGRLRDTSVANIALQIDGEWLTPDTPLLPGTTRERLIDEGFLREAPLTLKELPHATAYAVLNAMTGFFPLHNPRFFSENRRRFC